MNKAALGWLAVLFIFTGAMTIWMVTRSMGPRSGGTQQEGEPLLVAESKPLEEFTLTERSGKPFHSKQLLGKTWVASFFFTTCPSTCVQKTLATKELEAKWGPKGVYFVSITCDPQVDTPMVLREYANRFDAHPKRWLFLTGDLPYIQRVGKEVLKMPLDIKPVDHSEHFAVIGPAGNPIGYFEWKNEQQLAALDKALAAQVNASSEQPVANSDPASSSDANTAATSQAIAKDKQGNTQFTLIERDEKPFGSQDLLGKVWVTGFFFTTCPSTCVQKSLTVQALEKQWGPKGVHFVSISVDPVNDTPFRLREYADRFEAHPTRWRFLTGKLEDIQRIGDEFYHLPHKIVRSGHTEYLTVCDRQGRIRGYFDWRKPDKLADLSAMLGQLLVEEAEPSTGETKSPAEEKDTESQEPTGA